MNETITKIILRVDMINSINEKSSCKEHILTGDKIPEEAKTIFNSDNIAELSGQWGDPEAGSPIQYHWAMVETENGKSYEFEVFNLAIMMFATNDEKTRKLFRFLMQLERSTKRNDKTKI